MSAYRTNEFIPIPTDPGVGSPLILIVEDDPASQEILSTLLSSAGFTNLVRATNLRDGLDLFNSNDVDLVYLDVMLPDGDGLELTRKIREQSESFVPIILVTSLTSVQDKVAGLNAGADDFITKPIIPSELIARTESHLRIKRMMDREKRYKRELTHFNERLRSMVKERTQKLDDALHELKQAKMEIEESQLELLERLGMAAEYRDQETGFHIQRMSQYVYRVAVAMGLSDDEARLFKLAAPMHDLGKLGIQDRILHKPSSLEDEEYNAIKSHPLIGAQILDNPKTKLLSVAYNMARSHHERWDGNGYPDGLRGADIPLAARICAVADVFDALTSGRVYRPNALSLEHTLKMIKAGSGSRFDPAVVEAFFRSLPLILDDRDRIGTR